MKRAGLFGLALVALFGLLAGSACAEKIGLKRDLTYKWGEGFVDVLKGSAVVARYVYKDTPKPYIYPLMSPDGPGVTRGFPMEQIPGEPKDHPEQRSFWLGHGDVNGVDFWTEGEKSGKIVQTSIAFDSVSPGYWNIHVRFDWVGPDGKKICAEDRRYSFLSCDYGLLVSTAIELRPIQDRVKFGDNTDGFFALRLAPGIAIKDGKGHVLNSEGQKDLACHGKRARWCDYTGEVSGKTCGVTVFDTPFNYTYPTYWNVRDYGLFAADPFGGKSFTGEEKAASSLTLPPIKPTRFVYMTLIHSGKLDPAKLDAIADEILGKPVRQTPADTKSLPNPPGNTRKPG